MTWYDSKQAAVDEDNPAANEQITFEEWDAMVAYLKDKIINKAVDDAAIGDNKILVYDLANDKFVFEAQSAVSALNDITDVVISGVPADEEVLAYDSGSSKWINQTAAEAGLATVTDLASYLELAGGTMTGDLNMGDYLISGVDDLRAYDTAGIRVRDSSNATTIQLGTTTYAFIAQEDASMGTHKLTSVVDPTSAQDASTKNYDDTHLFTKEVVTTFTDGYVPIYNATSGKFEMASIGLSSYLPLAGGTMSGNIDMGDNNIDNIDELIAKDMIGIRIRDSNADIVLELASYGNAFRCKYDADMDGHKLLDLADPTSAQHAATKNYADTRLFSKEAVTTFTDGYVPVYRTASGKFEMEDGGGSAGLPVVDTTAIVKGSVDGTKLVRFEVDGITTGTTRVMTVPDKDITLCDTAEVMLLGGSQAMSGNLDLASHYIEGVTYLFGWSNSFGLTIQGGLSGSVSPTTYMYGQDNSTFPGQYRFAVPNAAKSGLLVALDIPGVTDTPQVVINYGLDMNDKVIADMKNSAASALSGTQKDIEIDIGGTPYYFTVYPTKA